MKAKPMTSLPGPSNSRNKPILAAEAALFAHAQELVETLVTRAKNGEPAALRIAMDRILPTGRGRPLPIELPPVRSSDDAQVAVGTIMDALKEGALSAREAVDLINVVRALTRLTGTIDYIKKTARREVAKAAQALGIDHFDPGRPSRHDYERRAPERNGTEDEAEMEEFPGTAAAETPAAARHSEDGGLQIVADSDGGGRRTDELSRALATQQAVGARL
jgi:hypothetical protein